MTGQDSITTHIAALVEEELGSYRAFAALPATEIEAMAERIARLVAPFTGDAALRTDDRAA